MGIFDAFRIRPPMTVEEVDDAVAVLENANRALLATVAANEAAIAALKMQRAALAFFWSWMP